MHNTTVLLLFKNIALTRASVLLSSNKYYEWKDVIIMKATKVKRANPILKPLIVMVLVILFISVAIKQTILFLETKKLTLIQNNNLYLYMNENVSNSAFDNISNIFVLNMFIVYFLIILLVLPLPFYNPLSYLNFKPLFRISTIILSGVIVLNLGTIGVWTLKESNINLKQYIETMPKSEMPMTQYKKVTLTNILTKTKNYRTSPNITPFPNKAVPNNQFIPIHIENTDNTHNKVTLVSSNSKNKKNLNYSFNPYFLADGGDYVKVKSGQSHSISAYAIDLPIIPLNKIVPLQNAYQLSVKTPTTLKIETTQLDLENATIEIIQNNKKTALFENEQPTSFDSSTIKTKQITITDNSPIYFNVKSNKPIKVKITSIPSK